jgi:hypothetical protein
VFVCGIAGLIISSIAGNNNGVVLTIGAFIAAAALVLLTIGAVTPRDRIDAFTDAKAEALEQRVTELVAAGADEAEVRALVREAMRLERR